MAGADPNGRGDDPKRGAQGGNVADAERLRRQGDRIREMQRLMWGACDFASGDDQEAPQLP
ncbi:MAG: hypothetical protein PW843_21205 [Azospirillaceae bacterium]|nr:hypothetical protein [Azospirillaceae bacterium]